MRHWLYCSTFTGILIVRVGFDLTKDKPLRALRDNDTVIVKAEDVEINGVDNITEFLVSHKNVPQIPTEGDVCVESRDTARDRLYNYIKNFKDFAYVGVIETDELTIEEVEEAPDVHDVL